MVKFESVKNIDDRTTTFTLKDTNVAYANTLRRLILTGVETVAFRADMTSNGTTTDVVVKKNDTPMTNEMLAHRIGLLPINVQEPLKWNPDKYVFNLKVSGNKDSNVNVTCSDFEILENVENSDEPVKVDNREFFVPNKITGQTCLIATLQPGIGKELQHIEVSAKATVGTGRENARFMPVSQCSYEYTRDTDPVRRDAMFQEWLVRAKMVKEPLDKASEKYQEFLREFNTMEVARCYLLNEKKEPYSFDFTVESIGILKNNYIIQRACEVGESMCSRYVNIDKSEAPAEISIMPSDSRIIGFDFLIRGHDHTLGNLLQTWLVENHIDGVAEPKITFAGYSVPHPLRDEMVLRIGVEDGQETTARKALALAARGCSEMFRKMKEAYKASISPEYAATLATTAAATPSIATSSVKRRTPRVVTTAKLG